jgi:hypothetical protein
LDRVAARARLSRSFYGRLPVTDEDLAEHLSEAGVEPTGETVAEVRGRVGPWLPAPLAEPPRLRRLSAEVVTARQKLVATAASLRAALAWAGEARAASFRAHGYEPGAVLPGPGRDPGDRAAVIIGHRQRVAAAGGDWGSSGTRPMPPWPAPSRHSPERLRRRVLEIREASIAASLGMPTGANPTRPGAAGQRAAQWQARLAALAASSGEMTTALENLPGPQRVPQRTVRAWWGIALDASYYTEASVDLEQLTAAAWRLLEALPQGRVPGHAPARLAKGHRYWIRRWIEHHHTEIDHLEKLSQRLDEPNPLR